MAGLSIAFDLLRRGVPTTVVDMRRPGAGATGASAGMLAPQYELAGPGPLFELSLRSFEAYPAFLGSLEPTGNIRVPLHRSGMLVANRDEGEHVAALRAVDWQRGTGLEAEVLEDREARRLHPRLGPARSWLWLPTHAHLNARHLARALHAAVARAGARLLLGVRVAGIETGSGRAAGVRLGDGRRLDGDRVVLAAGAWTPLLEGLPRNLPLRPVRGQVFLLRLGDLEGRPLVADHRGRYLVPRSRRCVLAGSTMEEAGYLESVTPEGRASVREAVAHLLPDAAAAQELGARAGLRPVTEDRSPILGPEPEVEGLYYATGYGRNGILIAPEAARLVAAAVAGDAAPELESFRADRFCR